MNEMNDWIKRYGSGEKPNLNDPADQQKIRQMIADMAPGDADKLMAVLNDPRETQRLMETPAAQKLLKLFGGGNG